jgi:hypothetical protein
VKVPEEMGILILMPTCSPKEEVMIRKLFTAKSCALLLMLPCIVYGVGDAADTTFPNGARLRLALTVKDDGTGALDIRNESKQDMTIQNLSNRLALVFLLMDDQGNIVTPTGKAKVDPSAATFILPSETSHTHTFKNLDFLTGTALFGYALEKGKRYRVVAIYRPGGPQGPRFSSNECVFDYR